MSSRAKLFSAAGLGDLDAVKRLVQPTDNNILFVQDEDGLFPGWTPLHWACRYGHVPVVSFFLEEAERLKVLKDLTEVADQDGDTALHVSVSWGHVEVSELLVTKGASLTLTNKAKQTPLDLAAPGFRILLDGSAKTGKIAGPRSRTIDRPSMMERTSSLLERKVSAR